MSRILSGLAGVGCQKYYVMTFGKTEEHDARLEAALTRIKSAGISGKCLFGQEKIKFLGHVIDKNGIAADPSKVTAITEMKAPETS